MGRTAFVHAHCHHKNGLGGTTAEQQLLNKMGLDYEMPATGCCGMAGSVGFEAGERYDVHDTAEEGHLDPLQRASHDRTPVCVVATVVTHDERSGVGGVSWRRWMAARSR